MITSPNNFQVRKRKWKTVLFLLRKRKRNIDHHLKHPIAVETFNGIHAGDSRRRNDADGAYCSGGDERDVSPRLGLDNVDANCSGVDERGENSREDDVGWGFEGSGKENSRLGLDHVVGEEGEEEEEVVDESSKSAVMVVSERKKDGADTPPDDDCCPICFDGFSIACKTNCGHWFCANCILQFWTYRTVLQKCNCPICARPISKLTPEASLNMMNEVEVVEVLKNVQRYNRLFQGGINGVIRKVFEVPNLFTRMLCGLMDPDRFRGNYYAMRSFALLMSCIYNIGSFEFIPTGTLGVRRLFDLCAIALVVILCLVGICHRLLLRQRVRRLAANQP
ncbi:putative transcription factor C2H2 family [Helianthus debilis subsp. tardiflorus]